jgi:hypothetical protein
MSALHVEAALEPNGAKSANDPDQISMAHNGSSGHGYDFKLMWIKAGMRWSHQIGVGA